MTEQIVRFPERQQWLGLLSNPHTMQDLVKLLGASAFVRKDFIRSPYEALLSIAKSNVGTRQFSEPAESLPLRMSQCLQGASSVASQPDRLNHFKDEESFRNDLDHILRPGPVFRNSANC